MFKISFVVLFLTIPFLSSTPLWGVPLWVYGSLLSTIIFAVLIIAVIEKKWDSL
ncbi:MAG: hypothetical protein U9O64_07910 [Campylobacterota bacterium]|nr:hypothetical protein [Campylobacterota bacterium]